MSLDLASLKPLIPAMIPDEGQYFDVNVTLAASPSNFTVSIRTFCNLTTVGIRIPDYLGIQMIKVFLGMFDFSMVYLVI